MQQVLIIQGQRVKPSGEVLKAWWDILELGGNTVLNACANYQGNYNELSVSHIFDKVSAQVNPI